MTSMLTAPPPLLCSTACATVHAQALARAQVASETSLAECDDCGRVVCVHRAVVNADGRCATHCPSCADRARHERRTRMLRA